MEQILIATDDFYYEEKKLPKIVHDSDSDSDQSESERYRSESETESDIESDSESESDTADSKADSNSDKGQYGDHTRIGLVLTNGSEHEAFVKSFKLGMGSAAGVTEVVTAHKQLVPTDFSCRARISSYKWFSETVGKKCGGDPNVKLGCYFGSRDEIARILLQGFGGGNADEFGRIQLVPLRCVLDGAKGCEVGEDGLRYMLVCRVLLGKVEELLDGSEQVEASSSEFDVGVDCVVNPRRYYVWSSCINSHVMPSLVVSFKCPESLEGYVISATTASTASNSKTGSGSGAGLAKRSVPGRITFPGLVASMTRFLSPREMKIMARLLEDFRAKKFDFEEFRRKARLIAGDRLDSAIQLAARSAGKGSGAPRVLPPLVNRTVQDMQFPAFIAVLAEFLPSTKIEMLSKSFGDFKEKKIDRTELMRNVRLIVGSDNVLSQAVNAYRIRKQRLQDKQSGKQRKTSNQMCEDDDD